MLQCYQQCFTIINFVIFDQLWYVINISDILHAQKFCIHYVNKFKLCRAKLVLELLTTFGGSTIMAKNDPSGRRVLHASLLVVGSNPCRLKNTINWMSSLTMDFSV